jgi:HD-GYP domain-containing protein (c-di-GMP phosphodiesterase class II)
VYSLTRLPVNRKSLAGYVAEAGEPLIIDDVYDIKSDVSYSFNASFDRKTSYRTRSIMVVPLSAPEQGVVGVLQLINAKDERGGVVPFSMRDKEVVSRFAQAAAVAIDKARDAREMVLRMVDIAEMRDPYETTEHARRVGAYATEIYQVWAERRGIPPEEINKNKGALRTAAILHDVGKIAISDTILRKPGALTYEEKVQMRYHTIYGARLFRHSINPWDRACEEVTLGHHERWDGTGYPGHIEDIYADRVYLGEGKRGEEIPVFARIVSIADVYDALVSRRSYKPPWKNEHALKHIHMQAGRHFDPELVDIFVQIHEIMRAIRARFPDKHE